MPILEFYCCDCDKLFESEPDGTGYEQAPCPICTQVCMTAEFEGKASKKKDEERFVVIAEFYDEESAEPLLQKLEAADIPIQVNLPDVTEGDFFTGGNDNVCVLVPADAASIAREIIQADEEE